MVLFHDRFRPYSSQLPAAPWEVAMAMPKMGRCQGFTLGLTTDYKCGGQGFRLGGWVGWFCGWMWGLGSWECLLEVLVGVLRMFFFDFQG